MSLRYQAQSPCDKLIFLEVALVELLQKEISKSQNKQTCQQTPRFMLRDRSVFIFMLGYKATATLVYLMAIFLGGSVELLSSATFPIPLLTPLQFQFSAAVTAYKNFCRLWHGKNRSFLGIIAASFTPQHHRGDGRC